MRSLLAYPGVSDFEDSSWSRICAPYVPLLAALHWQSQIPRGMLVKQMLASTIYVDDRGSQPTP